MKIKKDVELSEYTTYKTGGSANYFCKINTSDEAREAILFAKEHKIPFMIIGGGSNILISDKGFNGLVIVNNMNKLDFRGSEVAVGAGVPLQIFINQCAEKGLSGLEMLSGIPGKVGGAVVGNAGANGIEISDFLQNVIMIDKDGVEIILNKKSLAFSYRGSDLRDKGVLVGAKFKLSVDGQEKINNKIKITLKKRENPRGLSCGSFFKNPEGKLAGQLIDEAGFRGKKIGGAIVSSEHANFIINMGNATSNDIYNLSCKIKRVVFDKYNVSLEEEVRLVGDFG